MNLIKQALQTFEIQLIINGELRSENISSGKIQ
jgi:hypothetical protein